MKKIRKISACLLLVFASSILYFGCNQLLLEKPEEKENTSSSANSTVENATLSLSIKSIGSKKAARTIKPVFSDDDISSITLTGKKDGATTEITLGSWDTPSELQTASVSIEPGNWDFTLSLLMNGCSFSGTASKVISSGDDISLSFELSSSVTYGGIDFTLFLNGSAEYIEATLYDINGSEVVEPTVLSVEVSGEKTYIHYTRDINSSSEQLAIGTYRLKINFFTYSDKALMQNSYSAIVNVAAGFVSSAEQTINLNEIYKVSYNLDGGELPAGALMPERYSSISETIILVEPEKENFVFDGWYTTSTFTGEPVTKIPTGSSGNTILYAKFVSPYAYIGDTAYASLSKLVAAISNADSNEDITISLTSNVTQADLGKAETSATIAYAITNTTANSVSLLVPAAEKIEFSGDCSYMFKNCSKLVSVDFSGVDTYNASEIYGMFYGCSNLASVNLSGFDTSNVTSMMFLFAYCSKLETVDLSNFNTSSATSIHGMFSDCTSLTDVNLSSFDTSQADSFTSMFTNCSSLTQVDISSFTLRNDSVNAASMFYGCSNLETIYVSYGFDMTSSTTDNSDMFNGCVKLVGGKGTTFDSEVIDKTYARFDTVSNPGYFTAKPIGTKAAPNTVGDIVFKDGTAIAYDADITLTAVQKSSVIAMIFYIGSDYNNSGDTAERTLGLGMADANGLIWCQTSAKAYEQNITTIQCSKNGDSYEGDLCGKDNFSQIASFLGADDDTSDAELYPAFYFAINYKNQAGSNVTDTDFEDDWYVPSLAELDEAWNSISTYNAVRVLCDGTAIPLGGAYYWSSTQHSSFDTYAVGISNGAYGEGNKMNSDWRNIVIRAF